jgi:hypothetical protein
MFKPYFKPGGGKARGMVVIAVIAVNQKARCANQTDELQNLSIRLAIDQQKIGLKVALSMVAPVSSQRMVAISFG